MAAERPTREELASLLAALHYGQYSTNEDEKNLRKNIERALRNFDIGLGEFVPQRVLRPAYGVKECECASGYCAREMGVPLRDSRCRTRGVMASPACACDNGHRPTNSDCPVNANGPTFGVEGRKP